MLNKDQYNQDEYDDYYKQETQGAEISSSSEKSSNKAIILIPLLLLLIVAGGYYGYTHFFANNTDKQQAQINGGETTPNIVQEETTVKETNKAQETTTTERQITQEVQNVASAVDSTKGNMSPEEIAKVVQMVMMQMGQQDNKKETEPTTVTNSTSQEEDELLQSLSDISADTIQENNNEVDYSELENNKNVEVSKSDNGDNSYNKVTTTTSTGEDALSQLSDEITNIVNDKTDTLTDTSTYTSSLKGEVQTRSKEMRIIVVQKGDTLGKIAQRAYGNVMDYKKIYQANPDILNRPDRIYVGQKLRIPE